MAVLQTLFLTQAAERARTTRLCQRARKLPGDILAQTCVFGWLHDPHASLDDLTDLAAAAGVAVTPQALHDRLTHDACPAFFEGLLCAALEYACAATVDLPALLQPFAGVYAFDTTPMPLPDTLEGWHVDTRIDRGARRPAGAQLVSLSACLRSWWVCLVELLTDTARLVEAMTKRGQHWQRRARKQKRRKRPSAAQMIEDPQRALNVRQGWIPLT